MTVTYSGTSINEGNGMDAATGIFKAPVAGTYMFNFQGMSRKINYTQVRIKKNGDTVSGTYNDFPTHDVRDFH